MILSELSASYWGLAFGVAFVAGVVKGMVGFAMPMVLISGLTMFMTPQLALAGLILPTLVTNSMQALRQGPAEAWASIKRFRAFLMIAFVALVISSQLVAILPLRILLGMIGGPIVLFAVLQLAGWKPTVADEHRLRLELGIGAFAGFIGGMSGVWGPPTVAYLTALKTEKREQMRVQGVIYGLGAVALTFGHLWSGILNERTIWLSVLLVPTAVLGMWVGGQVQDRIDQTSFRRFTLMVLLIAGLNLLRRALF